MKVQKKLRIKQVLAWLLIVVCTFSMINWKGLSVQAQTIQSTVSGSDINSVSGSDAAIILFTQENIAYTLNNEERNNFLGMEYLDNAKGLLINCLPKSVELLDAEGSIYNASLKWEFIYSETSAKEKNSEFSIGDNQAYYFQPYVIDIENVENIASYKISENVIAQIVVCSTSNTMSILLELDNYYIYTPQDLIDVCNRVNSGEDFTDKTIYIEADIDMSGYKWASMGTSTYPFRGSIDGEKHTISNLNISGEYGGLIGNMIPGTNSYVKNLILDNMAVTATRAGGLISFVRCQENSSLDVKNCEVSGTITGSEAAGTGGIIGTVQSGKNSAVSLRECLNSATLSSRGSGSTVGGIVGRTQGSSENALLDIYQCGNVGEITSIATFSYCYSTCGGIIGTVEYPEVTIRECFMEGVGYGKAYYAYVGGLVGDLNRDRTPAFEMTNSYFNGNITAQCTNGTSQAGGLIGHTSGSSFEKAKIENCYAVGTMDARNKAGISCWHENNIETEIRNCFFDKDAFGLEASEVACSLGFLACEWLHKKVYNSYGTTADTLRDYETYNDWNGQYTWGIHESINDGLPHLQWYYGNEYHWEEPEESLIVQQVKKYTSSDFASQYLKLKSMAGKISDELMYKLLMELFNENGFTDPYEGVAYIQNSASERSAYDALVLDEMYIAHNYLDYLNNTPQGEATRLSLAFSGLIFSWEVGDYLDVTTYVEGSYPGVEKYKTLLMSIMNYNAQKIELMSNCKSANTVLQNLFKTYKIASTADSEKLLDDIVNAKSETELNRLQKKLIEEYILPEIDNSEVKLNSKVLSDAMNKEAKWFSIINATYEDIMNFVNLSAKLDTFHEYENFLLEIKNAGDLLPWELKTAAALLLKEMEAEYYTPIIEVLKSVCKETGISNKVFKIDKILLSSAAQDFLATVQFAGWIVNKVVDVSKLEKNSTYTQGYAYLASFYATKLKDATEEFLNKPTDENAWSFYYAYSMLYKMRLLGEESYIEMCKVEGLFGALVQSGFDIKSREEIVNETINTLKEKCEFKLSIEMEVPDEYQYVQKIVVQCPVDVYIYDSSDNLVMVLEDAKEQDVVNEHGRFVVDYCAYDHDYAKVAYLYSQQKYNIEIVGKEQGRVDFSLTQMVDGQCEVYTMSNQPIMKNASIRTSTDLIDEKSVLIDLDGNGVFEENKKLNLLTNDYVKVQEVKLPEQDVEMKWGEKKTLQVEVLPVDATYKDLIWHSDDESIIEISNNYIKAVGRGTTTITAKSLDTEEVLATCTVKVSEEKIIPYVLEQPIASEVVYGTSLLKSELKGGKVQYSSTDDTIVEGTFVWENQDIVPSVNDSNKSRFTVLFIPVDTINYGIQKLTVPINVNKAEDAPNMPEMNISVNNETDVVYKIPLPEKWKWEEKDKDRKLEVGYPLKVQAVYVGNDGDNYKNTAIEITITRLKMENNKVEVSIDKPLNNETGKEKLEEKDKIEERDDSEDSNLEVPICTSEEISITKEESLDNNKGDLLQEQERDFYSNKDIPILENVDKPTISKEKNQKNESVEIVGRKEIIEEKESEVVENENSKWIILIGLFFLSVVLILAVGAIRKNKSE